MGDSAVLNGLAEHATVPEVDSSSEEALHRQLAEQWHSRDRHDLQVRWRMGAMLNGHPQIGPPTVRLKYGRAIMKRASDRLALDTSELSRLRWFAYHFQSVEDLNSKHPEVKSWREVKVLLAKLSPAKGKGKARKTVAKNVAPQLCRAVASSLEAATERLHQLGSCPDGEDATTLLEKIQAFVEAVNSRLQVRLTFEKR